MVHKALPALRSQRFDFFFFLGSSSLSSASRFLSSLQQNSSFGAACSYSGHMATIPTFWNGPKGSVYSGQGRLCFTTIRQHMRRSQYQLDGPACYNCV